MLLLDDITCGGWLCSCRLVFFVQYIEILFVISLLLERPEMKIRAKIRYMLFAAIMLVAVMGCREDEGFSVNPAHQLTFSSDTVRFDTLFTEVSSSTYSFLVYNRNKESLHITHSALSGGDASPFRVNVDGLSGTAFSDIAVRGGDSLFVFVEVTVDPRGQDEPFEVRDSLLFMLESGVTQQVQLCAYGQDAVVLRGVIIDEDTHLTAERPYLIYDSLRINQGSTLNLEAGTRLYFSEKAELQVYGNVVAWGTADAPIIFRGARTEHLFSYLPYDRLTAQWGGITLHPTSFDNLFVHCDIHSGVYGLRAVSADMSRPKLTMRNSQIHNVDEDALQLTICNAEFYNSLFSNAGGHCVNILGGQLQFWHCTMANFFPWSGERGGALNISNFNTDDELIYPLIATRFANCIITGSKDDELMGVVLEKTDSVDYSEYAQYYFTHSLINSKGEAREPNAQHFANIVWEHKDSTAYGRTNFRKIDHSNFVYDFHLDSLSCARGIGEFSPQLLLQTDRDEQPRHKEGPIDAGCYQYVTHEE